MDGTPDEGAIELLSRSRDRISEQLSRVIVGQQDVVEQI